MRHAWMKHIPGQIKVTLLGRGALTLALCVSQVWAGRVATWWEPWTGATQSSGSCWAPSIRSSISSRLWPGAPSSPCTCLVFQSNLWPKIAPSLTHRLPVPFVFWAPTPTATAHWPRSPWLRSSQRPSPTSGRGRSLLWVRPTLWPPVPSSRTRRYVMYKINSLQKPEYCKYTIHTVYIQYRYILGERSWLLWSLKSGFLPRSGWNMVMNKIICSIWCILCCVSEGRVVELLSSSSFCGEEPIRFQFPAHEWNDRQF